MKFLVIEQDLRVSGTSQGIISRSFLAKLRKSYPKAVIDVLYLKNLPSEDQLHLLPVDAIETHIVNVKIPIITKWLNKFYWRVFNASLQDKHIHKAYASYIVKVDYQKYNHIFVRSSGLEFETILACKDLPILKKAIINFHDPYPLFWYAGTLTKLTNLELFRIKMMQTVVSQSKKCTSSAYAMAKDMEYLYGSRKKIYTLPHQYDASVFQSFELKKRVEPAKKVIISYHGAIMFGRNVDLLLEAYSDLVESNLAYKENTTFILRLRGDGIKNLISKYKKIENIQILDCLDFYQSSYEQIHETDITIILENGPLYCNILVGKAPFLAEYKKPVLCISPQRSELRNIIKEDQFIANMNDKEDIKLKLESLIKNRMTSKEPFSPFGDYFSDATFKQMLDDVLNAQ